MIDERDSTDSVLSAWLAASAAADDDDDDDDEEEGEIVLKINWISAFTDVDRV